MKNKLDNFAVMPFELWVLYLVVVAISPIITLNWTLFWAFPSISLVFYILHIIVLKVVE